MGMGLCKQQTRSERVKGSEETEMCFVKLRIRTSDMQVKWAGAITVLEGDSAYYDFQV